MEIHLLRASIDEKDLNDLIARHLPPDQPVEDVRIKIAADGVHLLGTYPMFINVRFETHWQLGIRAGKVAVHLVAFKAMGMPGNVFKSAILKLVADAAKNESWIQIEQETIVIDVDGMLLKQGLNAKTNLSAISAQEGKILIESAGP